MPIALPKAPTLSINKYEYNSIEDVGKFLKDFADVYKDYFGAGFGGLRDDEFLKKLGAEARHKAEILEKGYGYALMVKNFRHLLQRLGYNEQTVIKKLQKMLFEDYGTLYDKVVEMIAKKARLPKEKVRKILSYLNDERKFNEILEVSLGKRN